MAQFSSIKLTTRGMELQAKVQAGATLTFTRLGLGTGSWPFPQDVPGMTALVNEKKALSISEVKRVAAGSYQAQGTITKNELIATGYELREIGLFAMDPDDGEILYAACYSGDKGDYIPSSDAGIAYDYVINLVIKVGDADAVTVFVDPAAVAAKKDIVDHELKKLDPGDTDTQKEKHLSNAQAKVWQDHINNFATTHVDPAIVATKEEVSAHTAKVLDPADTNPVKEKHLSNAQAKVWQDHAVNAGVSHFPAGTSMMFLQAAAPVGWTKKSDWADVQSILVGNTYGSGGSDSVTSWTTAIGNHAAHTHTGPAHAHGTTSIALTIANLPVHSHTTPSSTWSGDNWTAGYRSLACAQTNGAFDGPTNNTGSGTAHGHGNTGLGGTDNTGSGGPTTHVQDTYTPKYVISIAAIKN